MDDYDEQEFEEEYNIYERVGIFNPDLMADLGTFIEGRLEYNQEHNKRFKILCKTLIKHLTQENIILFENTDTRIILDSTEKLKNIQYKNPSAYILGFWVLEDRKISKSKFKIIEDKLEALPYPIQNYDIIRYANLWIKHLSA